MNQPIRIALLGSAAWLSLNTSPDWAAGYPAPMTNPTVSDNCLNTVGGTKTLFNNQPCNGTAYSWGNSAFGYYSLTSNITGWENTAIGNSALYLNTTGSNNTATGSFALWNNSTGGNNVANGGSALRFNSTGWGNVANGFEALYSNTTGGGNVANGNVALLANTTGNYNVANGFAALVYNTTGSNNVANGAYALYTNTTGINNSANGSSSLKANTTGNYNVANGTFALQANTTGSNNAANGYVALYANTTGSSNVANGHGALYANTTGGNNTAVGYSALLNNKVGSNNIAIGYQAGNNVIGGSNNIYLGNTITIDENATLRLGGVQTSAYIAGVYGQKTTNAAASVPVYIDSTGKLGTLPSAQRYKDDIRDMNDASRRLLELRPVTYHYKQATADGSKPLEYGLIAEEVAKVYPDLVVRGKDGQIETVQYHKLTPMLLNEVQRLSKAYQAEQAKVSALESRMLTQTQAMAEMKQQMTLVQAQAQRMETLAARLAKLESKPTVGTLAVASRP